jgi:hypothetical protein
MKRLVTAITLPQVNNALRKAGIKDELVKGEGYFYFMGDEASGWRDSAVHVFRLNEMTVQQWVDQYKELKNDNDPELRDRRNEERYGGKKMGKQ